MRSLGLCFLSATILTVFIFFAIGSNTLVSYSDNVSPINSQAVKAMSSGRKLKRSGHVYRRLVGGLVNLDYPGYDPAPSSKASVQPKPIEHGTPLMPYVPGPTPPPPGPGEVQFP